MSWLQAKGKVDNWQDTEAWKLLKKFAKSGMVFTFREFVLFLHSLHYGESSNFCELTPSIRYIGGNHMNLTHMVKTYNDEMAQF